MKTFNAMKTFQAKQNDFTREWVLMDASDMPLGRIATQIATRLRGKDKPCFTPNIDCGDFVVVVNASKITLSGDKALDKFYYTHSGYTGNLKKKAYGELLEEQPEKLLRLAVKRMLPRNKLRKRFLGKLKIYAGSEHPHIAQQPKQVELTK